MYCRTRTRWDLDALVSDTLRASAPADRALKATLRAHPELDGAARRRLADGVLGVRCFEGRLAYLLGGVGLPVEPATLWAAYRVERLGERPEAAASLADPGRLRRLSAVALPVAPGPGLAARRSLPGWLAEVWIARFGEAGADALAAACNRRGPITARVRRGGRSPDAARDALAESLRDEGILARPGRIAAGALHLEGAGGGKPDIRGSAAWRAGRFEVQDEGSQLAVEAVDARPGQLVLDLCAGSGGKTLALADAMDEAGRVLAADVSAARLADLRGRVRRRELRDVEALELTGGPDDLERLRAWLPEGADRVLVDAPCTSLGTLRRGPHRRWAVGSEDPARHAALQRDLLRRGAALVAPGGRLVYVTCTLHPAENEAVAASLDAPGFEAAPALPRLGPGPITLRPDRHGTDGFFIVAWGRRGPAGEPRRRGVDADPDDGATTGRPSRR